MYSLSARMMPLNVAATLVKLAMPPPMMRILPSLLTSPRVMSDRIVLAYSYVWPSVGAPEYSP